MNANSQPPSPLTLWLRSQLLADPRKSAVMAVLLLVAGGLAVKFLSQGGPMPAAAGAALLAGPVNPADEGADLALRDDPEGSRYLANIDRTVRRDLFAVEYGLYPVVEPQPADDPDADRRRLLEQARLSLEAQAAHQQAMILAVQAQAQTLRLQSTIVGERPSAIINEQILALDDTIQGFRVVRITRGHCVVEKDGVEVTLAME